MKGGILVQYSTLGTVGTFLPFSIPERFHTPALCVLVATVLEETPFPLHWTARAAHYSLVASEFTAFLEGPQVILYVNGTTPTVSVRED